MFEEDPWFPLPSSTPHLSFPSIPLKFKCQNNCLPCPIEISTWLSLNPHTPKSAFPLIPTKPPENHIKFLHFIPSLKLVFISVISSPIDYLLLRLTRREPSPVWCWPWILPFQPEVNLGTNMKISKEFFGMSYDFSDVQLQSADRVGESQWNTLRPLLR